MHIYVGHSICHSFNTLKVMKINRINLVHQMYKSMTLLIEKLFNWIKHIMELINLVIVVIYNVSYDRELIDKGVDTWNVSFGLVVSK